ncbi:MAG: YdiY family protein [Lentisphaeria bacterium]
MKHIKLFLVLALAATSSWADMVRIEDGSVLHGTVVGVDGEVVHIHTSFGGVIKVSAGQVVGLSISKERFYSLQSGSTLLGRLEKTPDRTTIETSNGTVVISGDTISGSWGKDEESPKVLAMKAELSGKLRQWKFDVGVDIAGKTGNSERISTGGSVNAILQGPTDKLHLSGRGNRTKENDVLSTKEAYGSIDYETLIKGNNSWYVRMGMEYDVIELLDLRTTAALGWGYYFHNQSDRHLRGRLGLQYKHESFNDDRTESSPGLDIGLSHKARLGTTALVTDVTATPAFDDFNRYQIKHATNWDIPLPQENWKLQLGIRDDYNSMPVAGVKRLDISYFATLVMAWQ